MNNVDALHQELHAVKRETELLSARLDGLLKLACTLGPEPVAPAAVPQTEALMNEVEAAAYLRLKPQTLSNMRSLGGGPAYIKAGRAVRYERADLDNWKQVRRRESTSSPGKE